MVRVFYGKRIKYSCFSSNTGTYRTFYYKNIEILRETFWTAHTDIPRRKNERNLRAVFFWILLESWVPCRSLSTNETPLHSRSRKPSAPVSAREADTAYPKANRTMQNQPTIQSTVLHTHTGTRNITNYIVTGWPTCLRTGKTSPSSQFLCMTVCMCACMYACVCIYVCLCVCIGECMRACICAYGCV